MRAPLSGKAPTMSGPVTLILGGARSGKSACAERLVESSGRPVLYVATASAGDDEMASRIARHQAERPAHWRTVESPIAATDAIAAHANPGDAILLDCLTLWVSNAILHDLGSAAESGNVAPALWAAIEAALVEEALAAIVVARERDCALVLVSNEVGMGVVPAFPLGRRFQDILGRVNQAVAGASDTVLLMIAGIPVDLRLLADAGLGP